MSSFNVSEYNSYILINSKNTSSGKWHTLVKQRFVTYKAPLSAWQGDVWMFVMQMQKLRICKDSPRGPEYLNSLVFELTLNYFQYQTPSISKVTNEKTKYMYCHFTELRKHEYLIFIKKFFL